MTNRDNFPASVKRILAMRVGYFCSNPDCRRPTAAPASDKEKAIHFGKAAHISAAAPGGPRYDPDLTPEQRRSLINAIWLCSNCADIIDKDHPCYSTSLLNTWKKSAETFSIHTHATSPTAVLNINVNFELDEFDIASLQRLSLSPEDDIESTFAKIQASALENIATFNNTRYLPISTIPLNLILQSSNPQASVTLDGIAKIVMIADRINLISPPGTGKSTTLVQLTEHILNTNQIIAVLIPLGEWADYSDTFFECLTKRHSFRSFKPEHFMQLAYYGRLVLILDGWNELESKSRIKAENEISALRRDFPQLGIVVSDRSQVPHTEGVIIKIEPLSDGQQMELARKLCGERGEAIVDKAWRIPSLRELITIPLYLNTLLNSSSSDELPQTKDEILRLFITQHESKPEKKEVLQTILLGLQKTILCDLAVEATHNTSTTLSNENSKRTISRTMQRLQYDQQITSPLQPKEVLDCLVSIHSLVYISETTGISFQHQQFQEWYASFEVEKLILDSFQGNSDAHNTLALDIINWPAWEESILFACERLSRKDALGVRAVSESILNVLGIDPMLAAEMIYRATPEVWSIINSKIMDFVKRWHKPNTLDRAIRFMIISGQPDFSEYIWPLISNTDAQIYLQTLRITQPFRPSVLGPEAKKRLSKMPENIRCDVIAEIGHRSGFDGIEIAAELAKIDQSPQVVDVILEALQFRRADRHVKDILENACEKVWELLAQRNYPCNLKDPQQNARLAKMREALIKNETDPIKIINFLTADATSPGTNEKITQLIQSQVFPATNEHIHFALHNAFKIYPEAVASGILQRIATGLQIPYRAEEYLDILPSIDEGPIAAIALNSATDKSIARAACSIVGSLTVGRILDNLFVLHEKFLSTNFHLNKEETEEYQRLSGAVLLSRQSSFLAALIERSDTTQLNQIEIMCDLLARHGKEDEPTPLVVSVNFYTPLFNALKKWIKLALEARDSTQHLLSNIVRAIIRLPDASFVDDLYKMLKYELKEQAQICSVSRTKRQITPQNYTYQYRQAFAAIGNAHVITLMKNYLPDLHFGLIAAYTLMDISNKSLPSDKTRTFTSWNDYSKVKKHTTQLHKQPTQSCGSAEEIIKVVITFGTSNSSNAEQIHAIKLAKVALSMHHRIPQIALETLYALPQKFSLKRELLTAVAMAGKIVPTNILNAGLQELLTDATTEPWRLDENTGELMDWIELYAFSDQPTAVIEAINSLPVNHQHPWQMDRLLKALGHSPNTDALLTLQALAKRDPQIKNQYGWLNAHFEIDTEASAYTLLDLLAVDNFLEDKSNLNMWKLKNKLATLATRYPSLRNKMLLRYETTTDLKIKTAIENVLIELADPSVLLALIQNITENPQSYVNKFSEAIRKIAIGQRQLINWPDAFEQFSVPLPELRKKLFEMLSTNDAKSVVAKACLITIEKIRDEYGRTTDEERHPDIRSGCPWPKEAIDAKMPSTNHSI